MARTPAAAASRTGAGPGPARSGPGGSESVTVTSVVMGHGHAVPAARAQPASRLLTSPKPGRRPGCPGQSVSRSGPPDSESDRVGLAGHWQPARAPHSDGPDSPGPWAAGRRGLRLAGRRPGPPALTVRAPESGPLRPSQPVRPAESA